MARIVVMLYLLGASLAAAQPMAPSAVLIDRADKTALTGYTEIAFAWGQMFSPPQHCPRSMINLKEAMNRWTAVKTELKPHVYLSDPDLLKMPFVFVSTTDAFDLTPTEQENLRAYFEGGGFLFADNAKPNSAGSPGAASLRKNLEEVLPDARIAPVPDSHHLYHCFFDFDGPPQGSDLWRVIATTRPVTCGSTNPVRVSLPAPRYYLEGYWLGEDLVAVFSDKGYILKWNDLVDNEPQLRFAVNIMVYALTRGNTSAQRTFRAH